MDGCEEQFLVDNIKKDLNASRHLRIIATPQDDFSVEALSHILKNAGVEVKTLDLINFDSYANYMLGNAPPKTSLTKSSAQVLPKSYQGGKL